MTTALKEQGPVRRSAEVGYESEIHAFGGVDAMGVAHALFHADSRHLLHHLAQRRQDHRRELGLLLGTRLMRAAGQDWYERGDIWARVAAHRAGKHSPEPSPTTVAAVQQLVTATADTDDGPLHAAPAWPATFDHAGRVLAASQVVFPQEHAPTTGLASSSTRLRATTVRQTRRQRHVQRIIQERAEEPHRRQLQREPRPLASPRRFDEMSKISCSGATGGTCRQEELSARFVRDRRKRATKI